MKQQPLDISVSFDPYAGEPDRDGVQGAEILPDGRVHFRIIARDAREVLIDQFGKTYPLSPFCQTNNFCFLIKNSCKKKLVLVFFIKNLLAYDDFYCII